MTSRNKVLFPRLRTAMARLLVVGIVGSLAVVACRQRPTSTPAAERSWPAMGSFATIALPGSTDPAVVSKVAEAARVTIADVENELSSFLPDSAVSRLNRISGQPQRIPLRPVAAEIFKISDDAFRASGGAFDPTVGPLLHLWGFRGTNAPPAPPDAGAIASTARLIGWTNVVWNEESARLTVEGMQLDFGAVAKGYGVDAAFDQLRRRGCTDLMVNLGGNLRCEGSARPGRRGWVVAVRDPYLPYGEGSVGTLTLTDGRATATSGRYERFVEIKGRRYAHVIDPRNGQPVSGLAQVTVVADSAAEADALSTALFVLGPEAGAALLRLHYPTVQALFIPDPPGGEEPKALGTDGFLKELRPTASWKRRLYPLPLATTPPPPSP